MLASISKKLVWPELTSAKCTRAIYYFATDSAIDNFPSRGYKIGIRNRGVTFLIARSSFYPALFQSMSVKLTRKRYALYIISSSVIMYYFEIVYFFTIHRYQCKSKVIKCYIKRFYSYNYLFWMLKKFVRWHQIIFLLYKVWSFL